ncbi:MAG: ribonuclease III [Crocinitomicaceae bacterium]|nr:ribonuclease III [Crocinitomicaceae bacterium]MDG1658495.1 ribonuclease III [Crocinitomicaceae bacterium]
MLKRFGYSPTNVDLFRNALTHKSISNSKADQTSNERLEFLGDAILDSVIAEFLYQRFPNEDEGYLTKIKSKVVSRRTLGMIGHEMEIHSVLRYNKNRTIKLETIEGNAFEALIGAIYLDGGFESARASINKHVFRKYVNLNQILEEEIDFKSKLFIWSQKNRLPIDFEVLTEENNGSSWTYVVMVVINKQEYGRGTGTSKKKAEQAAAKETLELIGEV